MQPGVHGNHLPSFGLELLLLLEMMMTKEIVELMIARGLVTAREQAKH